MAEVAASLQLAREMIDEGLDQELPAVMFGAEPVGACGDASQATKAGAEGSERAGSRPPSATLSVMAPAAAPTRRELLVRTPPQLPQIPASSQSSTAAADAREQETHGSQSNLGNNAMNQTMKAGMFPAVPSANRAARAPALKPFYS